MSLNPRVDFAFKKLFGSEENKASLMALINAILPEEEHLTEIMLMNPFNDRAYSKDKLSILDVKAVDSRGKQYNIEMQVTDEVHYSQRALYYWSRLYANQLKAGDDYDVLRKTISIHVLNFNCFLREPDYHNVFHLLNTKSHRRDFDDMELHFIELEKFHKDFGELKTRLDHWTSFLTTADRYEPENMPAVLKNDPEIGPALEALEHLYLTAGEREIYEARLKWLRDERSAIKSAENKGLKKGIADGIEKGIKKGIKKGMEKGIEKGIKKGMKKGIEKGIEKGRTTEKLAIARNLLEAGLGLPVIVQSTGLSTKEIEKLKQAIETVEI